MMYFPHGFWTGGNKSTLIYKLLAAWNFNDCTGCPSACSAIGNEELGNFDATQSGGGDLYCITGKLGSAAQILSGTSTIFDTPDTSKELNLTSDKTFVFWFLFDTAAAGGALFGKYYNSPGSNYLATCDAGGLNFTISTDGTGATASTTGIVLSGDTWYFGVIRHDVSAKTISVQINNGTIFEATYTGNPFDYDQNLRLIESGTPGGAIDAFSIWDRILTPTEITYLYNSGIGKEYPF